MIVGTRKVWVTPSARIASAISSRVEARQDDAAAAGRDDGQDLGAAPVRERGGVEVDGRVVELSQFRGEHVERARRAARMRVRGALRPARRATRVEDVARVTRRRRGRRMSSRPPASSACSYPVAGPPFPPTTKVCATAPGRSSPSCSSSCGVVTSTTAWEWATMYAHSCAVRRSAIAMRGMPARMQATSHSMNSSPFGSHITTGRSRSAPAFAKTAASLALRSARVA